MTVVGMSIKAAMKECPGSGPADGRAIRDALECGCIPQLAPAFRGDLTPPAPNRSQSYWHCRMKWSRLKPGKLLGVDHWLGFHYQMTVPDDGRRKS